MKARPRWVLLAAGATSLCWCGSASAYRPFNGTDAAVAGPGQAEIELGPAEYLRQGSQQTLLAPSAVFNYGIATDWEFVAEGRVAHALTGGSGTSLGDDGVSLKHVLREGGLQEKPGPSIATEFGVLLPGIRDDRGTGAILTGIVSQRSDWGTVHLNAAAALTRQQHADLFASFIVEGPHDWPIRPVAEIFGEHDFGGATTGSALVGAIWQAQDNLAFDLAMRGGRTNDHTLGEIRAGLTFSFAVEAASTGNGP